MSIRLPKPLWFILAFLFAFVLYWPSMHGTPIWDDQNFWFMDPSMKPDVSYFEIWRYFGWPMSVSIQKFLLSVWHHNFFYYHFLNFLLHCANAFLVYLLGKELKFKYNFFYFLLFLIHPVCVISTSWMIQIKTLLCFFFAMASLLTFMRGQKNWKWMIASWILFYFSITSKSASLTLPVLFLVMSFSQTRFKKLYFLIPFFLLSAWGAHRVLTSPITIEGAKKATVATTIKTETKPVEAPKPKIVEKKKAPVPEVKKEEPKETPKPQVEINNTSVATPFTLISINIDLTLRTLYYYFWQVLLPTHTEPVKGLNIEAAGFEDYLHVVFLIIMCALFWKNQIIFFLGAAHFLLLPFLGIIPAPFMNITWVSDQHLYLVLPCLLAFWIQLIGKISWKYSFIIPSVFILAFSYKTWKSTPIYKNQVAFYETSLQYNPYNIPISYNLAFAQLMNGQWIDAYHVVSNTYHLAESEPQMKKNIYYPYLVLLYFQMRERLENHEN